MSEASAPSSRPELRRDCLSFADVLAQSIANIAPTASPALNIPFVFASAGNGTWLAYVIATAGLLLVSLSINRFARRSSSAGSLYTYITVASGPRTGALAGWGLFLAYLFTGAAVPLGFAIYAASLLGVSGTVAAILLTSAAITVSFLMAWRDIQLSTKLMLVLELVSVGMILLLGLLVLARHGFRLDLPQLTLEGVTPQGIRLGLVLAVFSYVGFESATALGDEARDPLRTIPRSVISSVAIVGSFFVLMSLAQVQGFRGSDVTLDQSTSPLAALAAHAGVPFLAAPVALCACVSFFACCLASINAGSRVLFSMARSGHFHDRVGHAHVRNATPHVAVAVTSALVLVVPAALLLRGITIFDAYAYLGTIATYGFLLAYVLIAVGAPLYLRRQGALRPADVVLAAASVAFLVVPMVGSVWPVPAPPYDTLPYVFAALLLLGGAGMAWSRRAPAR